ncbi:uncharacterized protein LOC111391273 [Olea europaea var. sylvestris]|uniref:uncharacterized protein LOC111391273 n=1 Tax=Olea europaea var. sylvestris TaxID=158386 RepID=UPI000C1CE237|nr:uncharacterized protein LOC111391273 [Olea europaea var. sylvestris]
MNKLNLDLKAADEKLLLQLNELDELRMEAYENSRLNKEHPKKFKLFPGKLRSRCSGPYTITQVFSHGAVGITYDSKGTFKVNGQRLKHYWSDDFSKKKSTVHLRPPE